jgi:hypothetical protein
MRLFKQHLRFATLTVIILIAAATRLLPHPPNLTPIGALALFGGAQLGTRKAAFGVSLMAMALSDVVLALTTYGWSVLPSRPFVYAGMAVFVCLGFALRRRVSAWTIGGAALTGALAFFFITNFGVWLAGGLYPRTLSGLAACYVAAIPFFRNSIIGDLLYSAALFGGFALAQRRFAVLREEAVPVLSPT